jgi:L-alanine-DL-glutamate epimerase-like enolase superfamily enzyme
MPQDGLIHTPGEPGLGMELDPAKIETDTVIFA